MKCTVTGAPYTVYGYKGRQVRDNIHMDDLSAAFWEVYQAPRCGEVYNIGGGRASNISMLEAIEQCQEIAGRNLNWRYSERNRKGDHRWWITNLGKFKSHYPNWQGITKGIGEILTEIHQIGRERWER